MKNILLFFISLIMLTSCTKKKESKEANKQDSIVYNSFGNKIIADDAIAPLSMLNHYKVMQVGDSINSKIKATVKEVCQAKGCWMVLDFGDGEEVMVKFKDYGFFVPKDIAGKQVIVNGKAYVKEITVNEQQHYAEDAGKSQDEIAAIKKPKRTFSFESDGVLVSQ